MIAPRVAVEGVTKLFGTHRALANVSFEVQPGRTLAILGENGAGKSTLLGVIAQTIRPTSGHARLVDGARALEPKEIRARLGVLSHDALVYGELSALENLRLFAQLYGVADAPARITALLDELALVPEARVRPARTYSRGMLQRLALARALLHDPPVLLLDEPTTGLDRKGAAAFADVLARARTAGRTIVVVTHDVDWLDGRVDHILALKKGRVVRDEPSATPFAATTLRTVLDEVLA